MKRTQMNRGTVPMKRGTSQFKRGRIKPRRYSKEPSVEGDSERVIRDDCDNIVRDIIKITGVKCITCGKSRTQVDIHPGHFITRKVLAIRWDVKFNIWPQCNRCNLIHVTSQWRYRTILILKIRQTAVEELERIGRENPELRYVDLLAIRDGLRAELERLKAEVK